MKRVFIICLLVVGLTYAAEDNIGTETKDISAKTAAANINFRFYDKNKRGATKLTNADSPSFNHLTSSNTVGGGSSSTSTSSAGSFKPLTSNTQPFRYLYNQQFYQTNPYLTYVQIPHAAQIAAQYSLQSNPVAHFLQTPNQIQYVSSPTVAQAPQIKFQSFANDYSSANTATSDSATSSVTSSQYVPQQTAVTSSYVPSATSAGSTPSSVSVSQAKQVQVPFYTGFQSAQPVYYAQQPLFTYFPQAANFIYQQPNVNFLIKQQQQQQQQLASLYGANRLGLYSQTPNQLAYLVPTVVVPQPEQDSTTTTTSNLKSSDKTVSNTQQSASSNSYTFGTKS